MAWISDNNHVIQLDVIPHRQLSSHNNDVIMGAMAPQIINLTIVYSIVYSGTDQRKHQSFASLVFVGKLTGDQRIPRTYGQ